MLWRLYYVPTPGPNCEWTFTDFDQSQTQIQKEEVNPRVKKTSSFRTLKKAGVQSCYEPRLKEEKKPLKGQIDEVARSKKKKKKKKKKERKKKEKKKKKKKRKEKEKEKKRKKKGKEKKEKGKEKKKKKRKKGKKEKKE